VKRASADSISAVESVGTGGRTRTDMDREARGILSSDCRLRPCDSIAVKCYGPRTFTNAAPGVGADNDR
jgi:hypothetical protein